MRLELRLGLLVCAVDGACELGRQHGQIGIGRRLQPRRRTAFAWLTAGRQLLLLLLPREKGIEIGRFRVGRKRILVAARGEMSVNLCE